jgi:hypothetical protein
MRSVPTLIFAGVVSVAGFAVFAQPPSQDGPSIESMIQSLTTGSSTNVSIADIVTGITGQLIETPTTTDQPITVVEVPLTVEEVVPEANRVTAETMDTRTGRYLPKLKINFNDFPLRSLPPANNTAGGNNVARGIAQRIESRLRLSPFDLVIEDRTAIVSGTVATDRQRSLIETMLRFEPGIDAVQNRITVASEYQ